MSVPNISIARLALAFFPVLVVVAVLQRWSLDSRTTLYGVARMLAQLLLVGYVLVYVFEADQAGIVLAVLVFMLCVSSWIALRPLKKDRPKLYFKALAAMGIGGGLTFLLITQGVLDLAPWFSPRFLVPLGGMIFASCMNAVSLAGERFQAETLRQVPYAAARAAALRASLIPLTNSLFAVGLVSIPGMMTGQILSGVSPLVAARYQIMVMCMIFGAAGISSACFLAFLKPAHSPEGVEDFPPSGE